MDPALPVRSSAGPPARITGPSAAWARDGAIAGLATGYLGPAIALFGFTLHPWLVACTLACGVGGALLGATTGGLLERARRQVPLPMLAVLLPLYAAQAGLWWSAGAAWLVGAPTSLAATYGAVAGGVQMALFWLPYTVVAVLGQPRWPVVASAVVVSSGLGLLARWVHLSVLGLG